MLLEHLTAEGFSVLATGTGIDALRAVRGACPDLVLLDMLLPGLLDGFRVLRTLRDSGDLARTPVILITAVSEGCQVQGAIAKGARDYLIKPYSLHTITTRIERVLRDRSPNRQRQPVASR